MAEIVITFKDTHGGVSVHSEFLPRISAECTPAQLLALNLLAASNLQLEHQPPPKTDGVDIDAVHFNRAPRTIQ